MSMRTLSKLSESETSDRVPEKEPSASSFNSFASLLRETTDMSKSKEGEVLRDSKEKAKKGQRKDKERTKTKTRQRQDKDKEMTKTRQREKKINY